MAIASAASPSAAMPLWSFLSAVECGEEEGATGAGMEWSSDRRPSPSPSLHQTHLRSAISMAHRAQPSVDLSALNADVKYLILDNLWAPPAGCAPSTNRPRHHA
ncbi:hypothetical protein K458DRAFT_386561 [Lentithecium fluviatile CBS 122367]|uniref:Uncharacterized protein n=1 Tax=Lentithecium fluviatile CBS 122367 TaxID=1168545 RepID=A0A6G1J7R9_9PLEO|nr:hypothetical protein K458DRAFT_386561 [Lentithecium fluviatile CBS 122367]